MADKTPKILGFIATSNFLFSIVVSPITICLITNLSTSLNLIWLL